MKYIQIDSESGHEGAICREIQKDMEALGLKVVPILPPENYDTDGYTLMITAEGDPAVEPLILGAHLDTVVPGRGIRPVLHEDGYLRSSGDTILAADDKAGVAAIAEALRAVTEQNIPHRTIQAFFTIGEEVGLVGSRSIPKEMLIARYAVLMDTSHEVGRIVICAPGQLSLTVTVHGKAAHAANAPEKGISAILVAAKAVNEMKLLRIDEETTANIGTFEAIGPTNIISPEAKLVFEIRSKNPDKLYAQADSMIRCLKDACEESGATMEYDLKEGCPGYRIPEDHPLVRQVFAACEKIGVTPFTAASGGGSDANIFNQYGINAINVATGMENVHTTKEQISLENLEKLGQLVFELIKI